jgi:hypothetical protein
LNPRHRGSLFPKIFESFGKMVWKKPFFKRVSSKISARMVNFNEGDYVIDAYEWSLMSREEPTMSREETSEKD